MGIPAVVMQFPPAHGTTLWEMTVVPVASGTGFVQPVFIRFIEVNATAAAGEHAPKSLYFDSMAYSPSKCTAPLGDMSDSCRCMGRMMK